LLLCAALLVCSAQSAFASGETLIIDAGHGGADGGAVSDSGVEESGVNLSIAARAQAVAALLGITTIMTRDSEDIDYPEDADTIKSKKLYDQKRRVALINQTDGAMLLSIHQNSYPDARPTGTQVLYAATEGSREWGESAHNALVELLCPENRRVAAPISDSIYLMKNVSCPAILVECGFLSNAQEAQLLQTDEYQIKLALVLIGTYWRYVNEE
jgi:N-acetylmuramoyl-L-alanine amidase